LETFPNNAGPPHRSAAIIENLLYERSESESRVNSLARLSAEVAARTLFQRLRTPQPPA
jgi:hypothetical protein